MASKKPSRFEWRPGDLQVVSSPVASDSSATLLATASTGDTMPWHVEKNGGDCGGDTPYAVIKDSDGSTAGCHATQQEADDQVAALYANEEAEADTVVSDEETEDAGGKPNSGTKKDKRLKENKSEDDTEDLAAQMQIARAKLHSATVSGAPSFTITGMTVPSEITINGERVDAAITAATKVKMAPQAAGWSGTICVEGVTSGDFREFAKGAITWADPPIPLRWKKEDAHGGSNDVTVAVGTITSIKRVSNRIEAEGVFDMGSEDGREAHRRVAEGFLKGISIDADDIQDADVELVWPEAGPEEAGDELDDLLMMMFAQPEKVVYHAGRIRAATLVDIPAFVEAYVSLTSDATVEATQIALDDGVEIPDDLEPAAVLDAKVIRETMKSSLLASAKLGDRTNAPAIAPPAEWFQNPGLSVPMNVIVTEEGRVYGHAAHWGECHIGFQDTCVTPPYEQVHDYFMTGEMICSDGTKVAVGQVTLDTGHAPLAYSARRAAEHYDDTGCAVADVAVGNDEYGIWIAGAVRSDLDPARVRDLRAAGKVSGDWRRIGGQLRMVGLLGVNVAGYQTPKVRARVAAGHQMALVAAGIPKFGASMVELEQRALRKVMEQIAGRVKIEE